MFKGNEKDCICHKPNGKHTKYCDAFRLSEFEKKCRQFTWHINPMSSITGNYKIKITQDKDSGYYIAEIKTPDGFFVTQGKDQKDIFFMIYDALCCYYSLGRYKEKH